MRVVLSQKLSGIGGSERYLQAVMPELKRRGLDISFVLISEGEPNQEQIGFVSELRDNGIPTEYVFSSASLTPASVWRFRNVLEKLKPDLLHTNLIHADLYGAMSKPFLRTKPAIVSMKHGYSETYQLKYGFDPSGLTPDLFSIATRVAALQADAVVSISSGLANLLVQGRLVSQSRSYVIPYGFDFREEKTSSKVGSYRKSEIQIVSVSRLVAVKRLNILIEAMPTLLSRYPKLGLVIVGDGPMRESLQELAKQYGVAKHVDFAGFAPNVLDYIRDSDVFALPTAAEGFGRVVLEAWWHEKPVVCFNVPALNEIVTNDYNGVLVDADDLQQFGRALGTLLGDPSKCRRLGQNGRATFEAKYSMNTMIQSTLDLYDKLRPGRHHQSDPA